MAALASPSLAVRIGGGLGEGDPEGIIMPAVCNHAVSQVLSYRSGDKDVKACIELMSHPVSDVGGTMNDVMETRKTLEKETSQAVACAWASGAASVLSSWFSQPRSRPYEVSNSDSVSTIIASTRAKVEMENKWNLVNQTAVDVVKDCPIIRSHGRTM
jgi:hypothetical protein